MKQIFDRIKENIIISLSQGSSTRDIAKRLKIFQSTVAKYLKIIIPNHLKRKTRRPSKISEQTKRYIGLTFSICPQPDHAKILHA